MDSSSVPEAVATATKLSDEEDLRLPSATVELVETGESPSSPITLTSAFVLPLARGDVVPRVQATPTVAVLPSNEIFEDEEDAANDIEAQKGLSSSRDRPEYVSVSFAKPTSSGGGFSLGMTIVDYGDGVLRIGEISPSSLLADAPLEVHDEIIRINGADCRHKSSVFASDFIRKASTTSVTIVVRNPHDGANTRIAWSCIIQPKESTPTTTKPTITSSTLGLSLVKRNGEIRVSDLKPKSLLANAALEVGDKVLVVNETNCCSNNAATIQPRDLIQQLLKSTKTTTTTAGKVVRIVTTTKRANRIVRPRFISATLHKERASSPVGVEVGLIAGLLRVTAIQPSSPFDETPIGVGDQILSINNENCSQSSRRARELLQQTTGPLMVVVQVDDGNPSLVATMITKPSPNTPVGIAFDQRNQETIHIKRIAPDGLVANSLLNVGDRLVSINDYDFTTAITTPQDASDVIGSSDRVLKIVTRTERTAGVVVFASSHRGVDAAPRVATAATATARSQRVRTADTTTAGGERCDRKRVVVMFTAVGILGYIATRLIAGG